MNAVGIDVSNGKSMVAVMQPLGVVAASFFEVAHTESELKELAKFLKRLPGETKVVMEYTGSYYEPIARFLHNEGIYVSVVNAILIHNYSGNSVRRAKTDKKDSVRIVQYALGRWLDLREYIPAEETRGTLTLLNRQYSAICKHKLQFINNLISLIDQSFPNANEFFDLPVRQSDELVYQFLNRKRFEGKLYKVYMTAAANKFLRIYYARVHQALNARVFSRISQAVNILCLAVSFSMPAFFQWKVFRSGGILSIGIFFRKPVLAAAFFSMSIIIFHLFYFA